MSFASFQGMVRCSTFGSGALMAGATGAIFAMIYPVTTTLSGAYLGKAFVVCVVGGLGSVQGALEQLKLRERLAKLRELPLLRGVGVSGERETTLGADQAP